MSHVTGQEVGQGKAGYSSGHRPGHCSIPHRSQELVVYIFEIIDDGSSSSKYAG